MPFRTLNIIACGCLFCLLLANAGCGMFRGHQKSDLEIERADLMSQRKILQENLNQQIQPQVIPRDSVTTLENIGRLDQRLAEIDRRMKGGPSVLLHGRPGAQPLPPPVENQILVPEHLRQYSVHPIK